MQTTVRALNGETLPAKIIVPTPVITKDNIAAANLEQQWPPQGWEPK